MPSESARWSGGDRSEGRARAHVSRQRGCQSQRIAHEFEKNEPEHVARMKKATKEAENERMAH